MTFFFLPVQLLDCPDRCTRISLSSHSLLVEGLPVSKLSPYRAALRASDGVDSTSLLVAPMALLGKERSFVLVHSFVSCSDSCRTRA